MTLGEDELNYTLNNTLWLLGHFYFGVASVGPAERLVPGASTLVNPD